MKKLVVIVMVLACLLMAACGAGAGASSGMGAAGSVDSLTLNAILLNESDLTQEQQQETLRLVNDILAQYDAGTLPAKAEFFPVPFLYHSLPDGTMLPKEVAAANVYVDLYRAYGVVMGAYVELPDGYVMRIDVQGDLSLEEPVFVATDVVFLDAREKQILQDVSAANGRFESIAADRVQVEATYFGLIVPNVPPVLDGSLVWNKADNLLHVTLNEYGYFCFLIEDGEVSEWLNPQEIQLPAGEGDASSFPEGEVPSAEGEAPPPDSAPSEEAQQAAAPLRDAMGLDDVEALHMGAGLLKELQKCLK